MGPGFAEGIGRSVAAFFILAILVAVGIGAALAIGLPHLWHWLKPLIHGWTA